MSASAVDARTTQAQHVLNAGYGVNQGSKGATVPAICSKGAMSGLASTAPVNVRTAYSLARRRVHSVLSRL